jgi:hypothetical protein
MKPLSRLSLWVRPERRREFAAVFAERLAPVLEQHGLTDPAACEREKPDHIFSQLFAVDVSAQVEFLQHSLIQDPAWQKALRALSPFAAMGDPIRHRLALYCVPSQGRTVEVDSGYHQGVWHCFTAQDGLYFRLSAFALHLPSLRQRLAGQCAQDRRRRPDRAPRRLSLESYSHRL